MQFYYSSVIPSNLPSYPCHSLTFIIFNPPFSFPFLCQVRALGYKIVIIIFTDVIPTDPDFKSVITKINTLPVTLVIRLCTGRSPSHYLYVILCHIVSCHVIYLSSPSPPPFPRLLILSLPPSFLPFHPSTYLLPSPSHPLHSLHLHPITCRTSVYTPSNSHIFTRTTLHCLPVQTSMTL